LKKNEQKKRKASSIFHSISLYGHNGGELLAQLAPRNPTDSNWAGEEDWRRRKIPGD